MASQTQLVMPDLEPLWKEVEGAAFIAHNISAINDWGLDSYRGARADFSVDPRVDFTEDMVRAFVEYCFQALADCPEDLRPGVSAEWLRSHVRLRLLYGKIEAAVVDDVDSYAHEALVSPDARYDDDFEASGLWKKSLWARRTGRQWLVWLYTGAEHPELAFRAKVRGSRARPKGNPREGEPRLEDITLEARRLAGSDTALDRLSDKKLGRFAKEVSATHRSFRSLSAAADAAWTKVVVQPNPYPPPPRRDLEASIDDVWDALKRRCNQRHVKNPFKKKEVRAFVEHCDFVVEKTPRMYGVDVRASWARKGVVLRLDHTLVKVDFRPSQEETKTAAHIIEQPGVEELRTDWWGETGETYGAHGDVHYVFKPVEHAELDWRPGEILPEDLINNPGEDGPGEDGPGDLGYDPDASCSDTEALREMSAGGAGAGSFEEFYDWTEAEALDEGEPRYGRKVVWLISPGTAVEIDPDYVQSTPGNQFDIDKLDAVAQQVEGGGRPHLGVGYGDVRIITKQDIVESRDAWARGETLAGRPFEAKDVGKLLFTVRNGNHRIFGALIGGERRVWMGLTPNMMQEIRDCRKTRKTAYKGRAKLLKILSKMLKEA